MPRYRLISLKRSIPSKPGSDIVCIIYQNPYAHHHTDVLEKHPRRYLPLYAIHRFATSNSLDMEDNPENLVSLCFLAVHGIEIKSIYSHKGTTTECVKSVKELSDQSMRWTLGWSFLMLCGRVAAFWDQNRSSKVGMTTTWKAWKVSNHGVWDVTRQLVSWRTWTLISWEV